MGFVVPEPLQHLGSVLAQPGRRRPHLTRGLGQFDRGADDPDRACDRGWEVTVLLPLYYFLLIKALEYLNRLYCLGPMNRNRSIFHDSPGERFLPLH